MQVIQNILRFLDTQASIPEYFGVFHIIWIALTIAASVALCILWKTEVIKKVKGVVIVASLILFILGLYKQIVLSFEYYPELAFHYDWNTFPWHFLSVPLVIGLFIGATSGSIHKHFLSYFAIYGLLAGLWGMFRPGAFVATVGLNVYSMLCYGTMIALAVLIIYSHQIKLNIMTFVKALPVFVMLVAVAISLNELAYLIFPQQNISMFSISPHFASDTPVYSLVHNAFLEGGMTVLEYIVCVLFYLILVSAFALIPFLIAIGLNKLLSTDFDLEYERDDMIALAIRKSEGLDGDDDSEEIFKFNGKVDTPKNTYRQTYFKNLHTNFGKNNRGSCGYVALSMLLTYYDTVLSDNIVPRQFDQPTQSKKDPNFKESPGAKFVFYHPVFNPEETTYRQYVRFINRNKNQYLHEHLLKIALKKKLNDAPLDKKSTDFDFGADVNDIKITADYYLDHDADAKRSEYNIETKTADLKTTHADIRNYVIGKIKKGYPVWVAISNSDEPGTRHAVVAYDYDEKLDKIYCHFGWQTIEITEQRLIEKRNKEVLKDVKVKKVYTRIVPEEFGYDSYDSALVIDFDERKIAHAHSNNYEVNVGGHIYYYCPDGTYVTKNDSFIVEFNKNKRKMKIMGIYGKAPRRSYSIIDRYGKVEVVGLGKAAFKNQKHLTEVNLFFDAPVIPKKAFQGCKSLTRVVIPKSVKKLKAKSFAGCRSLTTIGFQGTVKQWYKIKKSYSWDRNTGKYKVYCTDGIIYKFGAEHVQII